jgi:hypothetical protein
MEKYSEELSKIVSMMTLNLTYATLCIVLGIVSIVVAYKFMNRFVSIEIKESLAKDPMATAIFYGALVLGISISSGIIIGLACT